MCYQIRGPAGQTAWPEAKPKERTQSIEKMEEKSGQSSEEETSRREKKGQPMKVETKLEESRAPLHTCN